MCLENFVKLYTRAKGLFYSAYKEKILNIQVAQSSEKLIKFEVTSPKRKVFVTVRL